MQKLASISPLWEPSAANMLALSLALLAHVLSTDFTFAQTVSSRCTLNDDLLSEFIDEVIATARIETYDDPGTLLMHAIFISVRPKYIPLSLSSYIYI